MLLFHPVPVRIKGVLFIVDRDRAALCVPAAGIAEPPAFSVFLPGSFILVGPGSVGIQPVAVTPLFGGHLAVRFEEIPLAADLLPAGLIVEIIKIVPFPL